MLIDPNRSIIYLIGFMGSGKTTIGAKLAKQLGQKFYDIDVLIEERAKKPIAKIFEEDGATVFRAIETAVLSDVSQLCYSVVALGGGTIVEEGKLAIARRTGLLIWLDASVEETWDRISDTERRVLIEGQRYRENPLIQSNDPMQRIHMLKQLRTPFYNQADIHVDTTELTVDQVVAEILTKLDELEAAGEFRTN